MADTDEEQLLNDLLRDVGSADLQMSVPDMEARALAAWDAGATVRLSAAARPECASFGETRRILVRSGKPGTTFYKVICGVAAAVLVALAFPISRPSTPPGSSSAPDGAAADRPVAPAFAAPPLRRGKPIASPSAPGGATADKAMASITRSPITPIVQSIEFVPLMPMTAREFTGPFQIVRVQMPRASLGALTPLQHPGELVEADVLLGEDGIARAIHISTNESAYPWRPR
jgi:hypothetical protein